MKIFKIMINNVALLHIPKDDPADGEWDWVNFTNIYLAPWSQWPSLTFEIIMAITILKNLSGHPLKMMMIKTCFIGHEPDSLQTGRSARWLVRLRRWQLDVGDCQDCDNDVDEDEDNDDDEDNHDNKDEDNDVNKDEDNDYDEDEDNDDDEDEDNDDEVDQPEESPAGVTWEAPIVISGLRQGLSFKQIEGKNCYW